MKNRFFLLLLVAILTLCFFSCGGEGEKLATESAKQTETEQITTETAETDMQTDKQTEEETKPADDGKESKKIPTIPVVAAVAAAAAAITAAVVIIKKKKK